MIYPSKRSPDSGTQEFVSGPVRHLTLLTDTARARGEGTPAGAAFQMTFRELVSGALISALANARGDRAVVARAVEVVLDGLSPRRSEEPPRGRITKVARASKTKKQQVNCAPGRIRTCDRRIRSPLLYPLSYERARAQLTVPCSDQGCPRTTIR